ncbi:MAG: hypothetical protein M3340_05325 [Actinomycetota bacterium]|nr:hypothetical protein [Actinomycetota bacterium]
MAAEHRAWHSVLMPVYHDNLACTEGNNIERRYWRAGRGGRRLCTHCARLNAGMVAYGGPLARALRERRRDLQRF